MTKKLPEYFQKSAVNDNDKKEKDVLEKTGHFKHTKMLEDEPAEAIFAGKLRGGEEEKIQDG